MLKLPTLIIRMGVWVFQKKETLWETGIPKAFSIYRKFSKGSIELFF